MGLQEVIKAQKAGKLIEDLTEPIKRLESRVAQLEANEGSNGAVRIETQELSVAGASFDFTTIPTTFKHLFIKGRVRGTGAVATEALLLRLNNVSSADYDYIRSAIAHSAALVTTEGLAATSAQIAGMPGNSAPANTYNSFELHIPDYLEATQLPVWNAIGSYIGSTVSGNIFVGSAGGRLRVAGALTRITLLPGTSATFEAGSFVSLYGLN